MDATSHHPRPDITDVIIDQWAKERADDAGALARRIVAGRAAPQPGVSFAEAAAALYKAAIDVLAERQRQISAEGWTLWNDDQHDEGELAEAAASYALSAAWFGPDTVDAPRLKAWPWGDGSWKPTTARRDLVKAGALILAEIERLDRADARALPGGQADG